jgi:hypothetical protein
MSETGRITGLSLAGLLVSVRYLKKSVSPKKTIPFADYSVYIPADL